MASNFVIMTAVPRAKVVLTFDVDGGMSSAVQGDIQSYLARMSYCVQNASLIVTYENRTQLQSAASHSERVTDADDTLSEVLPAHAPTAEEPNGEVMQVGGPSAQVLTDQESVVISDDDTSGQHVPADTNTTQEQQPRQVHLTYAMSAAAHVPTTVSQSETGVRVHTPLGQNIPGHATTAFNFPSTSRGSAAGAFSPSVNVGSNTVIGQVPVQMQSTSTYTASRGLLSSRFPTASAVPQNLIRGHAPIGSNIVGGQLPVQQSHILNNYVQATRNMPSTSTFEPLTHYADAVPPPQGDSHAELFSSFLQFMDQRGSSQSTVSPRMVGDVLPRPRGAPRITRGQRGGRRGRPRKVQVMSRRREEDEDDLDDEEDSDQCLICHEERPNRSISCGHRFHRRCLNHVEQRSVCPFCKIVVETF